MQQRDIIKDQIELAGKVIGKAIAKYFDVLPKENTSESLREIKSELLTQIDIDIDRMLDFRSILELKGYLRKRYLHTEHLDLLSQFLFEVGKRKKESSPKEGQRYLATCSHILNIIGDMTEVVSIERIILQSKVNNLLPKKLLILSDMYGYKDGVLPDYMQYNIDGYICQHYDVSRLTGIDKSKNEIHSQYDESNINKAVDSLLELEGGSVIILAFSIGGTIGWRAAMKGMNVDHLIAISSTRLRIESIKPNCKVTLLYAEYDDYKPDNNWFESHNIECRQIEGKNHEMYKDQDIKNMITSILTDR